MIFLAEGFINKIVVLVCLLVWVFQVESMVQFSEYFFSLNHSKLIKLLTFSYNIKMKYFKDSNKADICIMVTGFLKKNT